MRGQRIEERDREKEREGEYTSRFECAYFQPRSSPETGLKRSDGETGGASEVAKLRRNLKDKTESVTEEKTMIDRKRKREGGREERQRKRRGE